ncbi:MAG TPA: acetylglutamate kinase [Saprospiraceae bacterium]|nr:acetylglutamate kinase [Saprospiraceae bacterium]
MKKQKIKILKIGGQVLNDEKRLKRILQAFAKIKEKKILVHGGGKKASELSKALGIKAQFIHGRRVTDSATLEVVTMVYAGLINKKIVSILQSLDTQAIGLTGADLNLIQAHKRIVSKIDYGFAGDIDYVNSSVIQQLIHIGAVPVFCAITHDKKGQLLNTNADTIAAMLAIALAKQNVVELLYCFEKEGVLLDPDDDNSVISNLNQQSYLQLKEAGIISAGMIPKLDNAFEALRENVAKVFICSPEAIIEQSMKNATSLCL